VISESRIHAPHTPVSVLVDDLFVPSTERFPADRPLTSSDANLMRICGAQTIALAAADAVGTLTDEDAKELSALLLQLPVIRVRYSVSLPQQHPDSHRHCDGDHAVSHTCANRLDAISSTNSLNGKEDLSLIESDTHDVHWHTKRLLYIGSCHEANIAALEWLLKEVLPILRDMMQQKMLEYNKRYIRLEQEGKKAHAGDFEALLDSDDTRVNQFHEDDKGSKSHSNQKNDMQKERKKNSRLEMEAQPDWEFAVVGSVSPGICNLNVCESGICEVRTGFRFVLHVCVCMYVWLYFSCALV
jgi:hypothetical protein